VSFVRCQDVSKYLRYTPCLVKLNSTPLRFVRAMLHYNIMRLCIGQRKLTQAPRSHKPDPSGTAWFLCSRSVRVTLLYTTSPHIGRHKHGTRLRPRWRRHDNATFPDTWLGMKGPTAWFTRLPIPNLDSRWTFRVADIHHLRMS
jgi:hypothetical protein